MKSMKKATSWKGGVAILSAIYLATLIVAPEALGDVGGPIVYAIAFATVGYIGGNVADNAVKGRFYRRELDEESRCGKE